MKMKKITINYSIEECEPFTKEIEVKKVDIEQGIIYCECDDSRIDKYCRDENGYVMIPMEEELYKSRWGGNIFYGLSSLYGVFIYVDWKDVKKWMDETIIDYCGWRAEIG